MSGLGPCGRPPEPAPAQPCAALSERLQRKPAELARMAPVPSARGGRHGHPLHPAEGPRMGRRDGPIPHRAGGLQVDPALAPPELDQRRLVHSKDFILLSAQMVLVAL